MQDLKKQQDLKKEIEMWVGDCSDRRALLNNLINNYRFDTSSPTERFRQVRQLTSLRYHITSYLGIPSIDLRLQEAIAKLYRPTTEKPKSKWCQNYD